MLKKILNLSIFFVLVYFLFIFLESDFFLIRKIDISSKNSLIEKDILNKFKKLNKKSLIFLDTNKIKNIIEEDVRVESIDIRKKYPDTLKIEIKDKKPIGIVQIKDNYFYIDNKFNVFAYYNELVDDDLPIINLPEKEDFDKFQKVLNNVLDSKMYKSISEIYLKDSKIYFTLLDSTLVYTNIDVSKKKYDIAYKIYKEEKLNNNLEYIDLRFKDIIIK